MQGLASAQISLQLANWVRVLAVERLLAVSFRVRAFDLAGWSLGHQARWPASHLFCSLFARLVQLVRADMVLGGGHVAWRMRVQPTLSVLTLPGPGGGCAVWRMEEALRADRPRLDHCLVQAFRSQPTRLVEIVPCLLTGLLGFVERCVLVHLSRHLAADVPLLPCWREAWLLLPCVGLANRVDRGLGGPCELRSLWASIGRLVAVWHLHVYRATAFRCVSRQHSWWLEAHRSRLGILLHALDLYVRADYPGEVHRIGLLRLSARVCSAASVVRAPVDHVISQLHCVESAVLRGELEHVGASGALDSASAVVEALSARVATHAELTGMADQAPAAHVLLG